MTALKFKIILGRQVPEEEAFPEGYFSPRYDSFYPGEEPPFGLTQGLVQLVTTTIKSPAMPIGMPIFCILQADTIIEEFRYRVINILISAVNVRCILVTKVHPKNSTPVALSISLGENDGREVEIFIENEVIWVMDKHKISAIPQDWILSSPPVAEAFAAADIPADVKDVLLIKEEKIAFADGFAWDEVNKNIISFHLAGRRIRIRRQEILNRSALDACFRVIMENQTPDLGNSRRKIQSCDVDLDGRIVIEEMEHIIILSPDGALLAVESLPSLESGLVYSKPGKRVKNRQIKNIALRDSRIFAVSRLSHEKKSTFHELLLVPGEYGCYLPI